MAKKAAAKTDDGKAAPAPAPKAAPKAAGQTAAKVAPKAAGKAAAPAASQSDGTPAAARPRPANRTAVITALAEKTGLDRKQIASVFTALHELIGRELGKKGPGQFVIPGLLKLKVVRKPATKARPGVNPFTGEPMTIKARPARNVVRAVPMKALKDLV